MAIRSVRARQILDSRGKPTVEATVVLDDGATGTAAVPSGASTGSYEAVELRDGDEGRYRGSGVLKAVANVNGPVAGALEGVEARDQALVDETLKGLDGTPNLSSLGANAVLAASLAVARSAASSAGHPLWRHLADLWRTGAGGSSGPVLPVPMMNILNGGAHASNNIDIQEFMIVPVGASSFAEALRVGTETSYALRELLAERSLATTVGDEGGFAPNLASNEEGIETVLAAVERAGYEPGREVAVALDVAATELWEAGANGPGEAGGDERAGSYRLRWSGGGGLSSAEMVDYWARWVSDYPICSIEDPLDEDDWTGWTKLTDAIGDTTQIVGDDLFVTNARRLRRGVELGAANAVLIKLNQIGTLSDTLRTMRDAEAAGFGRIVSHRSGETGDTFIADLAVATGAGQIKTGGVSRSERVEKYNRLLLVEEEVGSAAFNQGGP